MGEEKKGENKAEHRFSFEELLFAAVVAELVVIVLRIPAPSIALPFALLATAWYGPARGCLVGASAIIFSAIVTGMLVMQTWFAAVAIILVSLLGINAKEGNFVLRALLATILFGAVLEFQGAGFIFDTAYYLDKLPFTLLQLAINGIVAVALTYYLRKKE